MSKASVPFPQRLVNSIDIKRLEASLWSSADTLRANSDLKASEYSTPVLGIIFLKFADNKYRRYEAEILAEYARLKGGRREKEVHEIALEKCGFYLPTEARYEYLLRLPEEEDIAKALKQAMVAIESYQPQLKAGDVLPKDEYDRLVRTDKSIPKRLLQNFADIPVDAAGDVFGKIYEYFLGNFALAEGQGGGEFFTPQSVVRLMVEMIEPYRGRVLDPACGSGGMFVQSAKFIAERRRALAQEGVTASVADLFVCGQEKTGETVKLATMNLVVNGLRGEIKRANTYSEDPFESFGAFDYVLANPPFNVDDVSLEQVLEDRRFTGGKKQVEGEDEPQPVYGVPRKKTKAKKKDQGKETVPNANYLWINLFATSLKPGGRAGLVMANSASDARHSEADIRRRLIGANVIDAMVTLPSNMFYTVTLPATLWFFDRAKGDERILFIDARNVFVQVDRAHREFSAEQIENLAMISQLRRGKRHRFVALVERYFEQGMAGLRACGTLVKPLMERVVAVVEGLSGREAAVEFLAVWEKVEELEERFGAFREDSPLELVVQEEEEDLPPLFVFKGEFAGDEAVLAAHNVAQQGLLGEVELFLEGVRAGLKGLDQALRHAQGQGEVLGQGQRTKKGKGKRSVSKGLKDLKGDLEGLHGAVKAAAAFFGHGGWLQERFPGAVYEDVTGLCKLATVEEVAEQDFSLNPGRYVGVVIEEDGKTEEEFVEEILGLNGELERLNAEARELEQVIAGNLKAITGDV